MRLKKIAPIVLAGLLAATSGFIVAIGSSRLTMLAAGFILVLAGFMIARAVARNPDLFWPILVVSSIAGTGLMPRGYTIIDEFLLGLILLGGALSVRSLKGRMNVSTNRLHLIVFLLLMAYLFFQSYRGMVALMSLRKVRWLVYYLMLSLLALTLHSGKFSVPSRRKLSHLVVITTLLYFGVYVSIGIIAESFGISRYDLQYAQTGRGINAGIMQMWGTTAYVMLPVVVALPGIFSMIRDDKTFFRRIGWITLAVSVFAALYYQSRSALLVILAFMIIALFSLGLRKTFTLMIVVIIIFTFLMMIGVQSQRGVDFWANDLFGFVKTLRQPKQSSTDIDRVLFMRTAFATIGDNWTHFLFGYGYRVGGFVMGPYLYDLRTHYGLSGGSVVDVSAEAFTNIVVDTGVMGLFLFIANFILVAYQLWRQETNPLRSLLLLSLLVLAGWLFVIDILDIVLFFFAIMPSGLLVQFGRGDLSPIVVDSQTVQVPQLRFGRYS